jgi:mannitol operon repressor
MRPEDVKEFSAFLAEFQNETDRGAALVGAALIDDRLDRLLRSHLCDCKATSELLDGGMAPIGSLSARIRLAHALGLIADHERAECDVIRKVRNAFAHRMHGLTFAAQDVNDLCQTLRANTPDSARFGGNARQLFINSVILTSLALWYRPEYAKPFRATPRQFDYQLAT